MFICQVLQGESMQQEEELMHLRSQVEFQKMQAAVIAQLEGERAALERERENLRGTVDSLRAAVRKVRLFVWPLAVLQDMDYMTGETLRLMVPTLKLCCNNEWISKTQWAESQHDNSDR